MRRFADKLRALLRCRDGVAAIEFAFVMPVLLILSIGALEMALLIFDFHNATEATRRGARLAVINYMMVEASDIASSDTTCTKVTGGDVTCTGVTLAGADLTDANVTFSEIYNDMQDMLPRLTEEDVVVFYSNSGITSASAATSVITPTVTVNIQNLTYEFMVAVLIPGWAGAMDLPGFRTTRVMNSTF